MYIYNRKTKKLKNFSDLKETIEFYLKQRETEIADLFFWNFGCTAWIPANTVLTADVLTNKSFELPEFPSEVVTESVKPVSPPQPPQNEFRLIEIATDKKTIETKQAEPKQPRRFKRYEARLKVIVSNKQKTFLSYSKNISEGGILLEDRIPQYMFNEESEIFISAPNKKEIIAFRCLPIGDEENPNRLKFQQSQVEYIEKLKNWLESSKT